MPLWCIAGFDGSIRMEDKGNVRVWYLQGRVEMPSGPLIIVENAPYCSGYSLHVRRDESAAPDANETNYISTDVQLNQACTLEFRWPRSGASDPSYRRTMLYNIMVGTDKGTMTQIGMITE
jgi:hypothetical protein